MKSAGIFLALTLVTAQTANAQLSPPPSPEAEKIVNEPAPQEKLSPEVSQKLTDKLPKYSPPAPDKPAGPANAPNPDVLQLEKITVTPRKRPRLNDAALMTTSAFNNKLANEKLSSLDRNVLNKFSLPAWFGGVSAAERARDEYNREQRAQMADDVFGLAKVVEINDPAQAKALRDAVSRP